VCRQSDKAERSAFSAAIGVKFYSKRIHTRRACEGVNKRRRASRKGAQNFKNFDEFSSRRNFKFLKFLPAAKFQVRLALRVVKDFLSPIGSA